METPQHHSSTSGFSLIELSIVLVIIGLLVGGVLVGRDLIRASQIRAVASQVTQIDQAVLVFRLKYNSLPGDMPNATSYWGLDPDGCNSFAGSEQPVTATCDGNGDGLINPMVSIGTQNPNDFSHPFEQYRAWQQLSNAGLIPGTFIGKPAIAWNYAQNTTWQSMFPVSAYPSAKYSLTYLPSDLASNASWLYFPGNYGHLYVIGGAVGPLSGTPVFTSTDAQALDVKMDDGRPGTGVVRTAAHGAGSADSCPTTADPATALYTTLPTARCTLLVAAKF
jgi:prepilin-type N-terminal cleavage/methylation domain-containing protein